MKFDHVENPTLRVLLEGKAELGKEELDFVVEETLDAWRQDALGLDILIAQEVERDDCIQQVLESWGDGEDGDALAFEFCRKYWLT